MKQSGSWATLLRGVSQQPPEVRQAGQHEEQVNLLPHPVSGLTRRRGSIYQALQAMGTLTDPQKVAMLAASGGYYKLSHTAEGKDYTLLIRKHSPDAAYGGVGYAGSPAVICYNRTDKVFVPLAVDGATVARVNLIGQVGISAAVSVGRFIVHAVNGASMTSTNTNKWAAATNYPVIWVRGGAYDRRYEVRVVGGASFYYDTPAASVPGSGTAISPQNIAEQLRLAAVAAGYTAIRNGAHIALTAGAGNADVTASDGGDGANIRAIAKTTDSVDKLPLMGINGQVVQIQTGPNDSFYVEAIGKDPAALSFAEVIWRECAGVVQGANISFGLMLIEGGTLRLGISTTLVSGSPVPQFVPSGAGDTLNNPAPAFLRGFPITYLGLFQDRLIVGAGAAVAVSAASDYFNFFRSTVVTVPIKDPFEMIAQGGEDDTLRYSVSYNRNLVIFGDKRQYSISGTTPLTPTSPNMSIMTTYADAADSPPLAVGGQIFYTRSSEGNVGMYEIKPGTFVDSAESFPASAQIGNYVPADAGQIEVYPGAPSVILLRSRAVPRSLYTFSYLDSPEGRKQDAWSRWDFSALNGDLLGIEATPNGMLLFWLRENATGWNIVADLVPMSADLGILPYLDSMRTIAAVTAATTDAVLTSPAPWALAFDATTDRFLIGAELPDRAELASEYPGQYSTAWVGIPYDSYVVPTNPYIRDGAGKAVLEGRLVITLLSINFKDSAGCIVSITTGGVTENYPFNGRVLGDVLNTIGTVPVTSGIHTAPVGRETREYKMTITSRRWFPFRIAGMSWTGQSYNRTPRANS